MKQRLWLAIIAIALAAGLASPASADPLAYAVDTNRDLYSVDLATGAAALIGSTGRFLEGLALSPGGDLFATNNSGDLFGVDPLTGTVTLIGSTGIGNVEGLDFLGGTLLGIGFTGTPTLYSIDTVTAAATPLLAAGSPTGFVRAIAVLDANTLLLRGDGPPNNTLYALSLTSGAVTSIGTLAVTGAQFAAMDFASDGNLYGLDNEGSAWSIDPVTATVTLIGDTGSQFWLDMAARPSTAVPAVPEPGALGLALGLALSLAASWRRRRA